jgi:hypothetical protein
MIYPSFKGKITKGGGKKDIQSTALVTSII